MGKQIRDSKSAPIFASLHKAKSGTPTMGGILIWAPVLFLALLFPFLEMFWPGSVVSKLNFLTREQTLLPLGLLMFAAVVGLIDDYLGVRKIGPKGGGLSVIYRLSLYTIIAAIGALWFYFKLDWDVFHVPFVGNFEIGFWYIPLFVFIIVATAFSVNEIDGLDGLAGGTLATTFAALGAICFAQGKFELAAMCGVIMGALVAFLWFNINPARFFMGDTGAMSLGITVGIIAMLTNTALLLPIIGLLFVIESLSVIIQVLSKKIRKKKVFLSAPIHHHFQALGWPEQKVVMRFWLISSITAVAGVIVFLLDKGWY
ncbi:phospho-N-acetylmuramoyl-pentapeptide-transferase [Candidatus Falkowbacteria bacterium]|nr:phospho-N-acetylmuramoyl-pentapeptide-transferase [Candidatus Falkowbacteria bacterium]MBT6573585.1 phospho-N-acetylmuramoyl-pentapeptide-transferase [Candidatus Falkowbacteria bacterium]MBT7348393.1 phospho-N-acetylmuramoyl-pentapeptide-transferase [Candidatus Falkowbacteria bacterium]MBT7500653.1 phospho-N-acetylmuramoyl-pentapeptide-transferase [Candidatus Falkowbacteria bacterium]